jgi:Mrp family chromosome partitioning ATPase
MNNYLATRSFLADVGKRARLPSFGGDPASIDPTALVALRRNVATTVPGPNVMVVTATRPEAAAATRLAGAVVDVFLGLERDTIDRRAQSQLTDARAQLQPAAKAVTDAQRALADYQGAHPGSTAANDAQLALLRTAVTHADDEYQAAQTGFGAVIAQVPVVDDSNLFVMDRPSAAVSKGHKKALVFGVGGGLLGGVAVSLMLLMVLVSRDNLLRSAADVEEGLQLPVVATVPLIPRKGRRFLRKKPPLVARAYTGSAEQTDVPVSTAPPEWVPEQVAVACRAALRRLDGQEPIAVIATSGGQGSTTVALGLAVTKREDFDRRTVLLDLNFWAPGLGPALGLEPAPGLAEVLRGEAGGDDVLQWPDPHIGVVTAGVVDDPHRLLATFCKSSICSDLVARGFDVVADLPPLPPAGRGDRIAEMFGNVLLVLRSGAVTLPGARTAAAFLPGTPSVVLNAETSPLPRWLRHDRTG